VTCMSWPCPVILFSAKITNTCWRSKYQTYIIKYLIDKQEILITIIERLYSSFIMSILLCLSNNSIDISPDLLFTFCIIAVVIHSCMNTYSLICDSSQEGNSELLVR